MPKRSEKYLSSFPENTIVLLKINQLSNNFCDSYILVKGSESMIKDRVRKIVEKATEVKSKKIIANCPFFNFFKSFWDVPILILEIYIITTMIACNKW